MEVYDVLAVNLQTGKVRILAESKPPNEAEAIMKMAIIRRGVGEECYPIARAGLYKIGDLYGVKQ